MYELRSFDGCWWSLWWWSWGCCGADDEEESDEEKGCRWNEYEEEEEKGWFVGEGGKCGEDDDERVRSITCCGSTSTS